jgi:hypothetical protein
LSDAAQNYHLRDAILSSGLVKPPRHIPVADAATRDQSPPKRHSQARFHRLRLSHATFVNAMRYTWHDALVLFAQSIAIVSRPRRWLPLNGQSDRRLARYSRISHPAHEVIW